MSEFESTLDPAYAADRICDDGYACLAPDCVCVTRGPRVFHREYQFVVVRFADGVEKELTVAEAHELIRQLELVTP